MQNKYIGLGDYTASMEYEDQANAVEKSWKSKIRLIFKKRNEGFCTLNRIDLHGLPKQEAIELMAENLILIR